MLSKKLIKDIQSLELKKHRDEMGVFVAEGPKMVNEFIRCLPSQIDTIYATDSWLTAHPEKQFPVEKVSEVELSRISQLKTPNEVLAVIRQLPSHRPVVTDSICLYLDSIQDPGNFGTILRIADWFGVKDIVATPGSADMYNSKVVQASMGSIGRVNVWYDVGANFLQDMPVPVIAAALEGRVLNEFDKRHACVLVIGNESKGISEAILKKATEFITIPRRGEAESLNAAVAAGIILSRIAG